ncbi:MAG: hypothetical protein AAF437_04125 [Pseudomonadota bacterium]
MTQPDLNPIEPDEIASWRLFASDALDDLQQLSDHAQRLCPDISEQFEASRSILSRALNDLDIALGIARARDFAPEFNIDQAAPTAPSKLALWIAKSELSRLSDLKANSRAPEKVLSDVCFTLGRLSAGGELNDPECRSAIQIAAGKSGIIEQLGIAAFRETARKHWERGLSKPRNLQARST